MTPSITGLPDPYYNAEFYADTPVKRLLAWGVDTGLILLLSLAAIPFTAFTALFFLPLLVTAVGFVYRVVTLTNGSATLGMRLMSVEVRSLDGSRLDLMRAFMHTLLYHVFFWTFVLQIGSIILMLTGPRRQALHDLVLGTAVINRAAEPR